MDTPVNQKPDLSSDAMVKVLIDLKTIAQKLKEIDEILANEAAQKAKPEDNVVWIVPTIAADFALVQDKPVQLAELVRVYSHWVEMLYLATVLNKGNYRNKALKAHIVYANKLCKTLAFALQKKAVIDKIVDPTD